MTKQIELNPEQDLELTFIPDFQRTPMVVTGAYEAVMPVAEAIQAAEATAPNPKVERTKYAAQTVIEAVQQPLRSKLGDLAVTVQTRLYDARYGTNFTDALKDKRNTERDLRFAGSIGLLQEEVCAKHRKALENARKIR